LLEECLLQTDPERSWLIAGYHDPVQHGRFIRLPPLASMQEDPNESAAIVMGIGGKVDQLLHTDQVRNDGVMTIKRFSGGGTVVMDHDAIWTTMIGRPQHFNNVPAFPRPLMEFTAHSVFAPLFEKLSAANEKQRSENVATGEQRTLVMDTKSCSATDNPGRVRTISSPATQRTVLEEKNARFALRENDYVLGERKMGGNAQSITGKGWLHHTSFLWDYQDENMLDYLKLPNKRPDYRKDRAHDEFLVKLCEAYPQLSKVDFCKQLREVSHDQFNIVEEVSVGRVFEIIQEKSGGLQRWWETKSRTKIVTDL
jgi:lipoate-protein ligase A